MCDHLGKSIAFGVFSCGPRQRHRILFFLRTNLTLPEFPQMIAALLCALVGGQPLEAFLFDGEFGSVRPHFPVGPQWNVPSGFWNGEIGRAVIDTDGVSPRGYPSAMLQFLESAPRTLPALGNNSPSNDCQFTAASNIAYYTPGYQPWQPYRVTGSAWFNQSALAAMDGVLFSVAISVWEPSTSPYTNDPTDPVCVAWSETFLTPDADPATWEQLTASIDIPWGMSRAVIRITAIDTTSDGLDDTKRSTFRGAFADSVRITLTPIPEANAGVVVGLVVTGLVLVHACYPPIRRGLFAGNGCR